MTNDRPRPTRACSIIAAVALAVAWPRTSTAQEFVVYPYLQLATPTEVWVMWETSDADESVVEWGEDASLGDLSSGRSVVGEGDSRIHEVAITGLQPNTRYYYRVSAGEQTTEITYFITPPDPGGDVAFRIVAMSDMQIDRAHPDRFREIVEEGVLRWADTVSSSLPEAVGFVLVPGDLVDNGNTYSEWAEHFFGPARRLLAQVPVYPVPGNHERNSDNFFKYFLLPDNGTEPFLEHWWTHDYGNVRIIGLDSNEIFRLPPQLDWLDGVLLETCDAPEIDFVFAQLHHPYQSELWPSGNANFTGVVADKLTAFSEACGKPSVHFYGHTHGYARGQARDGNHLMVNVATAGGRIDPWGDPGQVDYPETTVSQAEYGFVVIDVSGGETPAFVLERYGRGTADSPSDNALRDRVEIRRFNAAPSQPRPTAGGGQGIAAECLTAVAAPFADPDGDAWQASHWQVSGDCFAFDDLIADEWVQNENWWSGVDHGAAHDLSRFTFYDLPAETELCWRVRHRDAGLVWSPWSEPVPFTTDARRFGDQLLLNGGAENRLDGWDGGGRTLRAFDCGAGVAPRGRALFGVGDICGESETALPALQQTLPLDEHVDAISSGDGWIAFAATLAVRSDGDVARAALTFLDDSDEQVGDVVALEGVQRRWIRHRDVFAVPSAARAVRVSLDIEATSRGGYFDDVALRFGVDGAPDCEAIGTGIVPATPPVDVDEGEPDAGAVADTDSTSDAREEGDDLPGLPDDRGAIDAAPSEEDGSRDGDSSDDSDQASGGGATTQRRGCSATDARSEGRSDPWWLVGLVALSLRRRSAHVGNGSAPAGVAFK